MDKSSPSCWLTRVSKFLMIFPAGYFNFLSTNVFESLYRLDIWMVRRSGPKRNNGEYKVHDLINSIRYSFYIITNYNTNYSLDKPTLTNVKNACYKTSILFIIATQQLCYMEIAWYASASTCEFELINEITNIVIRIKRNRNDGDLITSS